MDDCALCRTGLRDAPAARGQRVRRSARLGAALLGAVVSAVGPSAAVSGAAATAKVSLLGWSVQHRPIEAIEVGDPAAPKVLVVGCIHGNEPAGIAAARRLAAMSPRGFDVWVVPVLNPDGRAANVRGNAHGVDLNRNFPYRWRPLSGVYDSGPRPLSEPEARLAYRLILRLHPLVSIWFHQHRDLVWASGGDRRVERAFAAVSRLPYHPLPPLRGSAIDWQNHALPGTTAFAAELPAGAASRPEVARYARAVLAAAGVASAGRSLSPPRG